MNKKMSLKKKIILFVAICISTIIASFLVINLYAILTTPKQYMITTENKFDYQEYYECSGYSSAYVLRSLGEDIDGLELYNEIPYKNQDGTVLVKKLVKFLKEKGYSVKIHNGTIWQLKHEISKGTPVIAFVRIGPNEEYTHYLPIVGYDKDNMYAVDSLPYKKNADDEHYNRVITIKDFKKMWKTGDYIYNTYITIQLE